MGFKVSKSKTTFVTDTFKCLGIAFSTLNNHTQISHKRLQGFANMRSPRSQAEATKRIGMLSYFTSYLPNLKTIIAPLLKLSTAKEFYWGVLEAQSICA